MSTTLSVPQVSAAIVGTLSGGTATAPTQSQVAHKPAQSLSVGNTTGKVSKIYQSDISVTTGTAGALSIDMTSLTDPLAGTIAFATVTTLLLTNNSTTTGEDFTVGGGTTPLFA